MDSNNTSTISGPALGRTINTGDAEPFAGTASSNINIGYYAVDALIGQMLYDTCTFDMKLQAGLHYANINFEEDIRYAGVDSVTTFIARNAASAKFWGTGPELAVNLDYKLSSYFNWDCLPLALVGNARAALLVGQSNTSFQALNDAFARGYDFNNENKWLVVPMWDMRFGLSSQMNFRCITANLEVGFEVLRYEQVIQTQNPIVIDTVMTDDYSNLGFYGPYVALGFCF